MKEEEIRSIALFFFFAVQDGVKSSAATSEAIYKFRELTKKPIDKPRSEVLISTIDSQWNRIRRSSTRRFVGPTVSPSEFTVPIDLSHWREFQKQATPEELSAVIYSGILKFDDKAISEGLEIPEGTLRYRLGKAYGKLGHTLSRTRPKGPRV